MVQLALESLGEFLRLLKERYGSMDLYDKAAILLMVLVKGHHFASGVRRTAFMAATSFLGTNGKRVDVVPDELTLRGVREGFYARAEIRRWLMGHEIRKFRRK